MVRTMLDSISKTTNRLATLVSVKRPPFASVRKLGLHLSRTFREEK